MGEVLKVMPGKGSSGGDRKSSNAVRLDSLNDLGISKSMSSRVQAIAAIPEVEPSSHAERREAIRGRGGVSRLECAPCLTRTHAADERSRLSNRQECP
jgi:hypothetical protein